MKTMATIEKSLPRASYLISLEILYIKQKIVHHWGKVSKSRASYLLENTFWLPKQLRNLSVYHFLTTQFSEGSKIRQLM